MSRQIRFAVLAVLALGMSAEARGADWGPDRSALQGSVAARRAPVRRPHYSARHPIIREEPPEERAFTIENLLFPNSPIRGVVREGAM
ncbi:hypothetical protein LG047_10470 [Methylocystis sp. WRRC1]|uniref:hypothetical protein n=1 Tax=Methylocystis sp. WRRC1 TaxID=1732014 RepID=UPI001D150BBC|nr:hypothetical protein [Methylocystis sp. WRRC1]MCC3245746.1 hypothetical protein [Methylocystis sp. WRRC1]